jgi:hypothetical protein
MLPGLGKVCPLKICPEPSGNELSESVFKIFMLSVSRTAMEYVRQYHFVEPGGEGKLRVI